MSPDLFAYIPRVSGVYTLVVRPYHFIITRHFYIKSKYLITPSIGQYSHSAYFQDEAGVETHHPFPQATDHTHDFAKVRPSLVLPHSPLPHENALPSQIATDQQKF